MSTIDTCETCNAFSALTNECRKNPPQCFPINQAGQLRFVGAYPGTEKDKWCRGHVPIPVVLVS